MNIELFGPSITEHEIATVTEAMRNGWEGEKKYWYVENFEREFAHYHGRQFGLMTPNCTSAIHLLLLGLGIGPGDEVIVPECTWIASASHITHVGANTVFADIDPQNWCMSPASLEGAITSRTKAVIVVDLYGNMPEMNSLQHVADSYGIKLIEDAAGAIGSVLNSRRAGSFGVGSVFSFHRTKTLTTGEGGILLTDDPDLYQRCHFLRDHGRSNTEHYINEEVAYKYMPCNLLAALGYAQLQRIEELVQAKRELLRLYRKSFADISDIYLNSEPPDGRNGAWGTALVIGHSHQIDNRTLMQKLAERGIESRPFFYPLSSMKAFAGPRRDMVKRNSTSYDISRRGILLPSAYSLKQDAIIRYCNEIRSILGYRALSLNDFETA